jgi:hypothetical protein
LADGFLFYRILEARLAGRIRTRRAANVKR